MSRNHKSVSTKYPGSKLVSITTHKGKLEGIRSISVSSLNPFCDAQVARPESICGHCYARRLEGIRPLLRKVLKQNAEALSSGPIGTIWINDRIMRFNAFGELINTTHWENLRRIALDYPETTFTLWTKRPSLVSGYIPSNLILVQSMPTPDVIADIDERFDWVFAVTLDRSKVNCQGRCMECLRCYRPRDPDESPIIWESIK